MLVFTNRVVVAARSDESAFTAKFIPDADVLGMADVTRAGPGHWSLADFSRRSCDDGPLVCET